METRKNQAEPATSRCSSAEIAHAGEFKGGDERWYKDREFLPWFSQYSQRAGKKLPLDLSGSVPSRFVDTASRMVAITWTTNP